MGSVPVSAAPGRDGTPAIQTPRFRLRELTVEDATARYLGWLHDAATSRFIVAAADTADLARLREYVRARLGRPDVLFLGIIDAVSGTHIGNIKYEPLDSRLGYAVMGVLIGETDYRGKGVTGEVLQASAHWLREYRGVTEIVLGVDRANDAAIRAYRKIGFVEADTPHLRPPSADCITMRWTVPEAPRAAND